MNRFFSGLCAAALLPTCLPAFDESTELQRADQATAAFGAALKSELVNAMQSGGAIEAITVCHTRANAIAAEVSQESGMNVSRVSLKNRNPGNAANEWQQRVLLSFEEQRRSGGRPAILTWNDTVETADGTEFRYMKAIPTGGLCLQCHGGAIAPDVSARLNELYPEDKAVGYNQGDIRGAFLVTRRLD